MRAGDVRGSVNAPAMVPESPGVGGFAAHAPLRLPRAGTFKKTSLFKRTARLAPDLLFDLLFYKKYPYKNIVAYCFF